MRTSERLIKQARGAHLRSLFFIVKTFMYNNISETSDDNLELIKLTRTENEIVLVLVVCELVLSLHKATHDIHLCIVFKDLACFSR